jgi:hypothetical protein
MRREGRRKRRGEIKEREAGEIQWNYSWLRACLCTRGIREFSVD